MLVLTRKIGQTLRIGNDVTVTIVSFRHGGVRLGIEAPRDVTVLRGELEGLEFEARDDGSNS